VRDVIEIDGLKAVVTFEPEIGLFRGEFVGLCGKGGADFYANLENSWRVGGWSSSL
jgi:predicted HicB family RNase H-like nuclease